MKIYRKNYEQPKKICVDCGELKPRQTKGRCRLCYLRFRYATDSKYRKNILKLARKNIEKNWKKIKNDYVLLNKQRQKNREWRANNLEKIKKYKKTNLRRNADSGYARRNRDKRRAEYKVYYEISRGRLSHPTELCCSKCRQQAVLYHHHKGYSINNYLDVIALCKQCHYDVHFKEGQKYINTKVMKND